MGIAWSGARVGSWAFPLASPVDIPVGSAYRFAAKFRKIPEICKEYAENEPREEYACYAAMMF
ncbi:hypothetical protein [Prevotella sp. HUN102]|uniref:hypothetical protein n=1 Tax=Prevotella sp. HUN102 TaxID=1392486 RepID=UPI00048B9B65|nr:hypothetical protein [Prevotella sp. HUN102]